MKNWMIIGATSTIAEEVARLWAPRGYGLFLVARNETKLEQISADLRVRGADKVETFLMDATDCQQHQSCIDQAIKTLGHIDGILIAHGTLPDQKACEASYQTALKEIEVNALSVISLCTIMANHFEAQGKGNITVISSVAGDRGRQSNYVYGAAKGMVSIYLEGLRNRLQKHSIQVTTIKPGFVDTPMTDGFEKSGPLWASAEQVAKAIVHASDKGKNVSYIPFFWWGIMTIIKHIPEFIFKRLSL